MGKSRLDYPAHSLIPRRRRVLPHKWGRVGSIIRLTAPSPGYAGYFSMNGEELARLFGSQPHPRLRRVLPHEWGRVGSIIRLTAPSPGYAGYFPMNGEESARLSGSQPHPPATPGTSP